MSNEIEKLLQELRAIQSTGKNIPNTKDVLRLIQQGNWKEAGFDSEEEAKQWISDNPYMNLV